MFRRKTRICCRGDCDHLWFNKSRSRRLSDSHTSLRLVVLQRRATSYRLNCGFISNPISTIPVPRPPGASPKERSQCHLQEMHKIKGAINYLRGLIQSRDQENIADKIQSNGLTLSGYHRYCSKVPNGIIIVKPTNQYQKIVLPMNRFLYRVTPNIPTMKP